MGRVSGGREKAMKGKDKESGLEKRQNREVGQRQATPVFSVRGGLFCAFVSQTLGTLKDSDATSDARRKAKITLLSPKFSYFCYRQCIHRCSICPDENFTKSDTCQRIYVDASANCHVDDVSLDFASSHQYLLASRCRVCRPGMLMDG